MTYILTDKGRECLIIGSTPLLSYIEDGVELLPEDDEILRELEGGGYIERLDTD